MLFSRNSKQHEFLRSPRSRDVMAWILGSASPSGFAPEDDEVRTFVPITSAGVGGRTHHAIIILGL